MDDSDAVVVDHVERSYPQVVERRGGLLAAHRHRQPNDAGEETADDDNQRREFLEKWFSYRQDPAAAGEAASLRLRWRSR